MTDILKWLASDVPHAKVKPPATDGGAVLVTQRPGGGYGPIPCQLPEAEVASLRAELSVPDGWILETLYYDLSHTVSVTGKTLTGYRVAIHGTRVLARQVVPDPSGKPSQICTLNGGELIIPPGGTVPLYACLSMITPEGNNAVVVGSPGPDSHLWKAGHRPFLQYILITISTRIHYEGSQVFAERRWHPNLIRTMESIGGLEVSKDQREVNRARQDFSLMDDLDKLRPKGGRPESRSKPRPEQIQIAKRGWSIRQKEPVLSWDKIAARVGAPSGKTLQRWIEGDRLHEL